MSTPARDIPAHDVLAVRLCCVAGCTNEVRPGAAAVGPYANRCEEHYQAQRRRMSALQRGEQAEPDPVKSATVVNTTVTNVSPAPAPPRAGSYTARATALVKVAKRVDRAFAKAERARQRVEPQLRRAQEERQAAERAAEEFRAAVRELLAP